MNDQILKAYLEGFSREFGIEQLDEASAFERFANHCIVAKHYPDNFDPEDVTVGGPGDLGLDGIAILVNDHLVFSQSDVDFFRKKLRRLDVQFVFVQTKTSAHFEAADVGTFLAGVRQFFSESLPADANATVSALHEIKRYIFRSTIDMEESPVCRLYFATTGTWNRPPAVMSRVDQGADDLKATGLFSSVVFAALDAEGLKRLHRELHHKITREINFDKHAILPGIGGVEEAYIGIVPCLEYLKLICDDDGAINRRLFYDNVRDYQGNNPVNLGIADTIQDEERKDRFALLNNGVTVVASQVNKVGTRFRLRDYQIVNGCQTSHIIHANREHLNPEVYLPLKLIVTTDTEVTNQIIQGTNRQTQVTMEAFESLSPFQKNLEEFYKAAGRERQLYYERRSKQYENVPGVTRDRVVTLATQIKCFVAMFLDEPHSTHRYYGELLSSYRNRVFGETHRPIAYFVSGAALAGLDRLFAQGVLPRSWRTMRFQLLMVFRLQNEPYTTPNLDSPRMDKYCAALLAVLDDPSAAKEAFVSAGSAVERVEPLTSREPPERTKAFTTALIEAVGQADRMPASASRVLGTVKWFSDIRGYGWISGDDGNNYFAHYSKIRGTGYKYLMDGERVRFTVLQRPEYPNDAAVDIETDLGSSTGDRTTATLEVGL